MTGLSAGLTSLAGSALGALGSTSGSFGQTGQNAQSYGFSFTDGASATQQNKEFLLAQQQFNSAEALKNRAWQEYMASTQYQRVVEDLKKAGLNPALAYQNGGAAVTAGAQANSGLAAAVPTSYSRNTSQSSGWGVNSSWMFSNFQQGIQDLVDSAAAAVESGGKIAAAGLSAAYKAQGSGKSKKRTESYDYSGSSSARHWANMVKYATLGGSLN